VEARRIPGAAGPGGERLLAAHLLLEDGQHTPVDEGIVTQALNPMWVPDLEDYSQHHALLLSMLRTASYYVLDADQCRDAVASMPPALPSFPPLPFRRIWIETQWTNENGGTGPSPYVSWEEDNSDGSVQQADCLGIAINEVVRGREWQIFMPIQMRVLFVDGDEEWVVSRNAVTCAFHVTPHEILGPTPVGKSVKVWEDRHLAGLLQLAINGAMLITAKGVPIRELKLPRHQRKRLQRERWAPSMPKLYYVDLINAAEADVEYGKGRIYRHRWLVQGHWRHVDSGDDLCTCWKHRHSPRVAKYIEPYVKGPPGAPWIGRPVHRRRGDV